MTGISSKFAFDTFALSLSAEGLVALALAIPVSIVLIAIAYRIVRR